MRSLTRKWARELDYRLIKEVWVFRENRIAVCFAYTSTSLLRPPQGVDDHRTRPWVEGPRDSRMRAVPLGGVRPRRPLV